MSRRIEIQLHEDGGHMAERKQKAVLRNTVRNISCVHPLGIHSLTLYLRKFFLKTQVEHVDGEIRHATE